MSKFHKLRPSQIDVDPRFNRELEEPRAKAMARKIEPNLLGAPVVSKRAEGKYVALDGQHRMTACRMAGYDELVHCEVHTGLSLEEEAALFLRLNGSRKAIGMHDSFKAKLVAKDPVALEIRQIVTDAKLRVARNPGKCCIQAIQALYFAHNSQHNLPVVLGVLVEWSDGDPSFLEGMLIKALSIFLGKYPDVDLADLAKRLAPFSANRVINKIKRMRGVSDDVSPTIAACSVFCEIYNARRPKRAQLPSVFSVDTSAAAAPN